MEVGVLGYYSKFIILQKIPYICIIIHFHTKILEMHGSREEFI